MSSDVKTALDDLAKAGPHDLDLSALATRSWSAGRRRRRHRLVAGVTATVVLLGGAGVLVATSPFTQQATPPAANSGSGASQFPERIGHQWSISTIPDRASAVSLLIEGDHSTDTPSWFAVDAGGHRWGVPTGSPDTYPAISADGTKIGYLATPQGPYLIHDLANGRSTPFGAVGAAPPAGGTTGSGGFGATPAPTIQLAPDMPAFWSPDGSWVAMSASKADGTGTVVLLGMDGSVQVLDQPGVLAGWSSDKLAFLVRSSTPFAGLTQQAHVRLITPDGRVAKVVALDKGLRTAPTGWRASVSPSGDTVALVRTNAFKVTFVSTYSLTDGKQVGETSQVAKADSSCPTGWRGGSPVLATFTNAASPTDVPVAVRGSAVQRLLVVDPSLDSSCLVFASDALAGQRVDSVFGLSKAWFSWWWKELVLASLIALVALIALGRAAFVVRERRAMRAVSRTTIGP